MNQHMRRLHTLFATLCACGGTTLGGTTVWGSPGAPASMARRGEAEPVRNAAQDSTTSASTTQSTPPEGNTPPESKTPPEGNEQTPPPSRKDRYLVKLAAPAAGGTEPAEPASFSGRILLFFVPDTDRWSRVEPADAPFFHKLQPIASRAVQGAKAGDTIVIEDGGLLTGFGGPLDDLDGNWRVQAVLDRDFTVRGHLAPGNLVSESKPVTLAPDRGDEIAIELTRTVPVPTLPTVDGVEWIERRSPLLSAHRSTEAGREVRHRAGVVLPYGYHDLAYPRRMWPTIYVIGGFGATHLAAADAAAALRASEARGAIPQAVWVFLDAETAWGHHGFCDSETNGPVGKALVEEFIPFLEERFRLIAAPTARIVTGHSSGGWSALHLLLSHPDTFGACFASAPDPVDFSAFQRTDLYRDASLFVADDGSEVPSHRTPLTPREDRVLMTVRDEISTERALDPDGRSGQQWAAWDAMWSPYDPVRGGPRAICDPASGAIDPVSAEHWARHDLARRFERDPARVSELFATRIWLLCGSRDCFYLNEAVERLRDKLSAWRDAARARGEQVADGPGTIEILDGLTHDTMHPAAQLRFHRGMMEYLRAHGHGEEPPRPAAERGGGR